MKLTFYLNWMGPVSTVWYEDNNIPYETITRYNALTQKEITYKKYLKGYCCGRIDVFGHPEYPFNFEYGVDIMESESWYRLQDYLKELTLDYLPDTVQEIYSMFEKDTGWKIQWLEEK